MTYFSIDLILIKKQKAKMKENKKEATLFLFFFIKSHVLESIKLLISYYMIEIKFKQNS
jgi:hypothetical protein